jgi:hypothetical protein
VLLHDTIGHGLEFESMGERHHATRPIAIRKNDAAPSG